MKIEVAIIMTEFFRDFMEDAIAPLKDEMDITLYFYRDFNEVLGLYRSIPAHVQGVVVSGPHPEHIILSAHPNDGRVVRAFMNDPAAIYRHFLQLFHNYPGLTTERVFFDSFHLIGVNLHKYLYEDSAFSWEVQGAEYFTGMSLQEIIQSEKEVYQTHLKLWRANQVDVTITRFSSLMAPLREAGVNVQFLYPTKEYVQSVCREVAGKAQLAHLLQNQPAVLLVTARRCEDPKKHLAQAKMDQMGRLLHQYKKRYDPAATIVPAPYGYEILTSRQAVEACTGGLHHCWVQTRLSNQLDFPLSVGYGLGFTLAQARLNAVDANREAAQHPGQSYLINGQDELVGPLQKTGAPLVVSRKAPPVVREVASKTGLSSLTVQRVLSVMQAAEDGYITSRMVAQKLSVTQRSANRFLQALLANGQAEVIGMHRATTKGRPERLYRLLIEGNRKSSG